MPVAVFKQFSAVIFPVIVFIDVDVVIPVISKFFYPFGKFSERAYFQVGAEDGIEIFTVQNAALFERFKEFFRAYVVPVFAAGGETVYILYEQFRVKPFKTETLFFELFGYLVPVGIIVEAKPLGAERPIVADGM